MKEYFNDLLLYIQFLTRIPINKNLPCGMDNFKRGIFYFPVIGFIIGACEWFVVWIFGRFLPVNIVSVFVIISYVLITGGLHVDGWGDVFDGFFSFKGGGSQKIIEIMKDSRIGTYSCIAIICNFIIRYAGIGNLINAELLLWIITVPVIAKCCVVLICYIGKTAKQTGTGNIFIANVDIKGLILTFIVTALICIPILGIRYFLIIILINIGLTFCINKFCKHYINGHTGDTLGFTSEAIELCTLIIMSAIIY